MDALTIRRDSPLADDLALLFDRHTAEMHADTPPESIHMMPRSDLDRPQIAFYVMRDDTGPVAMGAIKTIAPGHGEIKSMHVLAEARGRGLSRRLLAHMLAEAQAAGLTRLSLETGAQGSFASARRLYAGAGFAECPPFGSYQPDPNSVFMSRNL
ncbi:GNAT family N-acetyltransferase [Paracoccus sp. M683]|uniref:GNAT family N-acetyltransferase n=1 Tax=Paracoccus sp. M683 TaxID=2594268 RepID=UPI00117E8610|nr:GNAT family N-acetyltransferase [Paracoccus sp. M683]TRW96738.1 GNAT family N-acetyltransferase [Paracoccus sp. M683]